MNCLSSAQTTTSADTQIDWAFSNIDKNDIKTDIYQTVHSFHNPIYIRIGENINNREENSIEMNVDNPSNIERQLDIMDVDEIANDAYPVRTNAEIEADILNQAQNEILSPNKFLTNNSLDLLLDIIKKNSPLYKPNNIFKIAPVPFLVNDIHILFEEPEQKGGIGHWICIHYISRENQL